MESKRVRFVAHPFEHENGGFPNRHLLFKGASVPFSLVDLRSISIPGGAHKHSKVVGDQEFNLLTIKCNFMSYIFKVKKSSKCIGHLCPNMPKMKLP